VEIVYIVLQQIYSGNSTGIQNFIRVAGVL